MPRGMPHQTPFRKMGGPQLRLKKLGHIVRALIKNERLEAYFAAALESQKYANRIIDVARYGPENKYTNDMLNFWLDDDEELKNKVYNVLVPRYATKQKTYTRVAPLPTWYNKVSDRYERIGVIEYLNNPLPPLPIKQPNPNSLQNILISAAKDSWFEHKKNKNEAMAELVEPNEK